MHAGQGGQHLHANAGLGAGSPGGVAQAVVPDDVALVVAFGLHQSRVVGVDVPAGGLFLGKVHRGALNRQFAAGGHAVLVSFQIGVGVHADAVAQSRTAAVAVEVKVAVVGHVADGGGISGGAVTDHQALFHQAVLDLQIKVAGESVGAGRTVGSHRHAVGLTAGDLGSEQGVVEAVQATVQAVARAVGRYMDDFLIQGKLRAANAVGKAAHGSAHAVGVQFVIPGGGVAQHHVGGAALAVRHDDAVDDGRIGQQLHLDLIVFQGDQLHRLAGSQFAEISDRNRHGKLLSLGVVLICSRPLGSSAPDRA